MEPSIDMSASVPATTSTATTTIRNRLATMRLGVSVRESLPDWYPNPPGAPISPTASGVFVKGIIEGGAAHAVSLFMLLISCHE